MQNAATPNSPILAGRPPTTEGDSYVYDDVIRDDILSMILSDGRAIGSVGCGYAKSEAMLVLQGRKVHGVDISPHAIDVGEGCLPRGTDAL
jgi:hypothetical protein